MDIIFYFIRWWIKIFILAHCRQQVYKKYEDMTTQLQKGSIIYLTRLSEIRTTSSDDLATVSAAPQHAFQSCDPRSCCETTLEIPIAVRYHRYSDPTHQ